jgi:hypothetical protein
VLEWVGQDDLRREGINGLESSLMVASFLSSFDITGVDDYFGSYYSILAAIIDRFV